MSEPAPWRKQSNLNSPDCVTPPAPPPIPTNYGGKRLNTEIGERQNEPPAAIQNAMMTKDKKPFTYTPGGLDLSQIKSQRMQKRITRNAEGSGEPAPTTHYAAPSPTGPLPPAALAAMQPQTPVAVFPQGAPPPPPPPPPHAAHTNNTNNNNQALQRNKQPTPQQTFDPNEILKRRTKYQEDQPSYNQEPGRIFVPQVPKPSEPASVFIPPVIRNEPGSIYVPPVQNNKSQLGSIYIPPVDVSHQDNTTPSSASSQGYIVQTPGSSSSNTPTTPVALNKAPTPWLTQRIAPQPSVPAWAAPRVEPNDNKSTRIIPIQIEGRESSIQQQSQQQSASTRVIPIQMEGGGVVRSPIDQQKRATTPNKFNPMTPQSPTPYSAPNFDESNDQPQWAPVQSRSFKVLQKMTDTEDPQQMNSATTFNNRTSPRQPQQQQPEYGSYNTAGVPLSQLRKMQLSEDDRSLMNKFKAQVDDENYLHRESDPRYRGAAIPSRAFRILQNMTDTAGDLGEVPRGPSRGPTNRMVPNQYPEEHLQGQYVPPSEQQVQEPRKYTGGSIPSRSFKILQARMGQDGIAMPAQSETPVICPPHNWGPSPAPSPIDPYWGYYPPDPYLIYNYISDMNAAYGFPPPHPSYQQPPYPPPPPTAYYPRYPPNYLSDSDEQGYSSTDEMAQYYHNYLMNYGYPPYQPNPEPFRQAKLDNNSSSPKTSRVVTTPTGEKRIENNVKKKSTQEEHKEQTETIKPVEDQTTKKTEVEESSEEESSEEDEESDTDTEVEEEGGKKLKRSSQKLHQSSGHVGGSLQALKSVSDLNIYTSESSTTVTNDEWEDCDSKLGDEEEEDDESESYEEEDVEQQQDIPHQLSVIYEESEHSDADSVRKEKSTRSETITSESTDSTATLDNEEEYDESDDDVLDSESSVTVRLPLQLKFGRTENDEDVTTVIVGDSQMKREAVVSEVVPPIPSVAPACCEITPDDIDIGNENEEDEDEDGYKSDEADVSFTFSIPTRSNSVVTVVSQSEEQSVTTEPMTMKEMPDTVQYSKIESPVQPKKAKLYETVEESTSMSTPSPVIDTEVTVNLSLPLRRKKKPKIESEKKDEKLETEESDSTHCEDDSSSTSIQSADTVVKLKEDTDEEAEIPTEMNENKKMIESFSSWMERRNSKDWSNEKTGHVGKTECSGSADEGREGNITYEAGVGQIQDMISTLLQKTKNKFSKTEREDGEQVDEPTKAVVEDKPKKTMKKESSQEESEEDDSGVTSDMSNGKHHNSETDTESEFSELNKMSKCQRASTHSRLFKLLQEECEKSDDEDDGEEQTEQIPQGEQQQQQQHQQQQQPTMHLDKQEESLTSRKERLTLPLNKQNSTEVDSLSSSSGVTSPSSPTVTDRLVKELVQSLLNKKKGKKFKKLPLAKLHAAALRILQEDMDPYDTSSASGDDGFLLSPVNKRHSQDTAISPTIRSQMETTYSPSSSGENMYMNNEYDYLEYYNTWRNPYYCEDYDVVPSRAFRMLREHPNQHYMYNNPMIMMDSGQRAKCPRIIEQDINHSPNGGIVPNIYIPPPRQDPPEQILSFADKQQLISKVFEKSGK